MSHEETILELRTALNDIKMQALLGLSAHLKELEAGEMIEEQKQKLSEIYVIARHATQRKADGQGITTENTF